MDADSVLADYGNADVRHDDRGAEEEAAEESDVQAADGGALFEGSIVGYLKGVFELKQYLGWQLVYNYERRDVHEECCEWMEWFCARLVELKSIEDYRLDVDAYVILSDEEEDNAVRTLVQLTGMTEEEALQLKINPLTFVVLSGSDDEIRGSVEFYRNALSDAAREALGFNYDVAVTATGEKYSLPIDGILHYSNFALWSELYGD